MIALHNSCSNNVFLLEIKNKIVIMLAEMLEFFCDRKYVLIDVAFYHICLRILIFNTKRWIYFFQLTMPIFDQCFDWIIQRLFILKCIFEMCCPPKKSAIVRLLRLCNLHAISYTHLKDEILLGARWILLFGRSLNFEKTFLKRP